jgi:hypothetical protein
VQKQRNGFTRAYIALVFMLSVILLPFDSYAQEAVCAEVKIEISQELTLERQAFDGFMRINNSLENLSLENVNINVLFQDENGNPVEASSDPDDTDAKFFIRVDSLSNIDSVEGGSILPDSTAEIHWLIIPAPGAAAGNPNGKIFFVGAELQYEFGGTQEFVSVAPDFIRVKPLPQLTLDYFLERDAYADDAFTPEIEPSEPFTLGVRIQNNGTGLAESVQIESAQPRIVENEQGLLIGFEIVDSFVNDAPAAPTLLIDFGEIQPGEASTGRWNMETTLSGEFTEFTAEFSHADEFGGQLTSLLEAVNTHFLIHDVRVDALGRDNVRDFLADDAGVLRVYESDNVDTVVADQSAGSTLGFDTQIINDFYHTLSTAASVGPMYVKVTDPYGGTKALKSAVRSDGKRLPAENAWLSKERKENPADGWNYYLNLFDQNTNGIYSIVFENLTVNPQAPVMQFIADRTTYETNQVSFIIFASDPNGTIPAFSAENLPSGAGFFDQGDGSAIFDWTPNIGQAGVYEITYRATDGALTASRKAFITVNPEWDRDGDGMDDAWELQYFGDLSRDGTGDFDGDGISDLQEFLDGTSPIGSIIADWEAPALVELDDSGNALQAQVAIADDGSALAVWAQFDGIRSNILANQYTPAGGWGVPELLETDNVGDAHSPHIAIDASGNAVAVWLQSDGLRDNVWSNAFDSSAGWGSAQLVETDNVGDAAAAQVAFAADGTAFAIWSQADGTLNGSGIAQPNTVWSNQFAAGSWGSAERIENNSSLHAFGTQLGVDGVGNLMALWSDTGDGSTYNISTNQYFAGIGWQSDQLLRAGAFGDVDNNPQVSARLAMNANGDAAVVWSEAASPASVWAATYTSGGGWSAAEAIEAGPQTAIDPVVAIDPAGNAIAAFTQFDGTRFVVRANRYLAGSGWSGDAPIGTSGNTPLNGDSTRAQISADGAGNAVVVWSQFDDLQQNIWANRFDAGGNSWEQARVIDIDNPGDAGDVQLAMRDSGEAVVVWGRQQRYAEHRTDRQYRHRADHGRGDRGNPRRQQRLRPGRHDCQLRLEPAFRHGRGAGYAGHRHHWHRQFRCAGADQQ